MRTTRGTTMIFSSGTGRPEWLIVDGRSILDGRWWVGLARLFILVPILCDVAPASAQFARVSGTVAAPSGEPLPAASVILDDLEHTRRSATTDSSGSFRFGGVPPGGYLLDISHVGYEAASESLWVGFEAFVVRHVVLVERAAPLGEVTIEEGRADGAEAQPGRFRVTPQQLARVPHPGLAPDFMGYLITAPGAMQLADVGGQLFVRGGTPTQNLVLVDGMPVYQPFHIVGFYSAFPAGIISYADVYTGGFGARYGGRLSSVIDIMTRNGNKERFAADVSIAPFLASALLEFPLKKDEVSLVVSARESIIERVAPALVDVDLPYRFGDYFAKFHAFLTPTSSFSATALKTFDRGDFVTADEANRFISWTNEAVGGRYQFLPAEYAMMSQFTVHVARYRSRFRDENGEQRSDVADINGDISFVYLLGDQELRFGIFGRSNFFEYDLGARAGASREGISEGGGYVEVRWQPFRGFRIEPGLRVHAYSSGISPSIEPRFRAQVTPRRLLGRHTFGVAWGLYRQQIVGITSLDDLTDAFVAWAPTPADQPVPQAVHGIASWAYAIGPTTTLRVEAYAKRMRRLSYPRYDPIARRVIPTDDLSGHAEGVDVRLERSSTRWFLNLGYSLSAVTYRGHVPIRLEPDAPLRDLTFHPSHDRRHHVNLAVRYDVAAYGLSLLWQYGSGRPFSQIHGFYDEIGPPAADRSHFDEPGVPAVAYAQPYAGRLPSYSRLDVSVDRSFDLGRAALTVEVGAVNAYGRKNLFDFSLLTGRRINQLPLIPYAGVRTSLP